MPETVNATFESPVADRAIVDGLVSNRDVVSSLQMLLNARARREAMNRIDEGDREGALDEIDLCTFKMVAASPEFGNSEVFRAELEDLQSLRSSLQNSEDDKMVRKQMAYRRESLRKGKP
jgi:hypothetical protein